MRRVGVAGKYFPEFKQLTKAKKAIFFVKDCCGAVIELIIKIPLISSWYNLIEAIFIRIMTPYLGKNILKHVKNFL